MNKADRNGHQDEDNTGSKAKESLQKGKDGAPMAPSQTSKNKETSDFASYLAASLAGFFWGDTGKAPNLRHDEGVKKAAEYYGNKGYTITSTSPTEVIVPGFIEPRVYDLMIQDPLLGLLFGIEVKATKADTVTIVPDQLKRIRRSSEGTHMLRAPDRSSMVSIILQHALAVRSP